MKVEISAPKFKPVSIVLETQGELNRFIDLIEAGYLKFDRFSETRDLGITISDSICAYQEDEDYDYIY